MTLPELPTDLSHEVAERVDPPAFAEVLGRASEARRRRRTTLGAGLAAAVVVAGLALVAGDPFGGDGRSQEPASPTGTWDGSSEVDPTLPGDVREVLGAERLHPWSASGSGGATAVLWGVQCPDAVCPFVVATRSGDRTAGVVLPDGFVTMTPVPGGWLLDAGESFSRLDPTGDLEPVFDPTGRVPAVEAGDTAVPTSQGLRLLRGGELLPVPTPDDRPVHSAYVTPAGRLVVTAPRPDGTPRVAVLEDGVWTEVDATGGEPPSYRGRTGTAVIAGHGDDLVLVTVGDVSDGSMPVTNVRLSHDAGDTWVTATGTDDLDPDELRDLSAMTVSAEGSAFLTTGSHGLVRVDPDGSVTPSRLSSHDHSVFLVAHRVCLVTEAGRVDHLQCSADDGRTWTPSPLPGFR